MNTYHVYLRKGGMVSVAAAGFNEDKRAKRFNFYADVEMKERVAFFSSHDVAGIHAPDALRPITVEDVKAAFGNLGKLPRPNQKQSARSKS